jgi:hypothetical protein
VTKNDDEVLPAPRKVLQVGPQWNFEADRTQVGVDRAADTLFHHLDHYHHPSTTPLGILAKMLAKKRECRATNTDDLEVR